MSAGNKNDTLDIVLRVGVDLWKNKGLRMPSGYEKARKLNTEYYSQLFGLTEAEFHQAMSEYGVDVVGEVYRFIMGNSHEDDVITWNEAFNAVVLGLPEDGVATPFSLEPEQEVILAPPPKPKGWNLAGLIGSWRKD